MLVSVVTSAPPREGESVASVNDRNEAPCATSTPPSAPLSSTRLGDPAHSVPVLRACILGTHEREVEGLLDTVRALLP